jgi:hypothetical protein
VDTERYGDITLADAGCHQQQRLSTKSDTFLGLGRANRRFHRLTLVGRQRQRRRSGARVRSRHPRLRINHASVDSGSLITRPNFCRAVLVAIFARATH